jgi:CHAT domain-containing protein
LTNLGNVALLEGNLESADRYHREALELNRQLDPLGAEVASSLNNVGQVARWRGQYETSRQSLEQALELKQALSPGSAWTANTLFELGELARVQGSVEEAERLHVQCGEIWSRTRPRSAEHAMSLFAMGAIERRSGRPESAERLWHEAVSIIEERRSGVGMTGEDRTRYGSRYHGYYVELARLLAEQGREVEAWDLLERARIGALRAVLSRRDAAPPEVSPELWFAANRLERQIDRLEGRLARFDPNSDAPVGRYREQLAAAEAELASVREEISRKAPRYAAFSTPRAIRFEQFLEALEPGTIALSYSVGEEQSMVLVAGGGVAGERRIRAFQIDAGAEELARRVNIFHALIARGRVTAELEPALLAQGRRLFDLLAGPAREVITGAERVLIIPDGPLTALPFAALVLPGERDRFLGHAKPLVFDASASVYVELAALREAESDGSRSIAAFGAPDYPSAAELVRRHGLEPLPGSLAEVEAIGELFGDHATLFLRSAATEKAFRSNGSSAGVVHCAVHAVSNARFPMDSALFFSIAEHPTSSEEDGELTAWEIVDSLHTEADVVVLSACGTARGQAVAGEGVIGLARAFQTAGARTLVASQWAVPDRSTAELMTRFYENLRLGVSTAEALQIAQRQTGESGSSLHPFQWASFQVIGDWR